MPFHRCFGVGMKGRLDQSTRVGEPSFVALLPATFVLAKIAAIDHMVSLRYQVIWNGGNVVGREGGQIVENGWLRCRLGFFVKRKQLLFLSVELRPHSRLVASMFGLGIVVVHAWKNSGFPWLISLVPRVVH